MPADHEQLSQPKLLLGEGEDEKRFFTALARHLNIADVQVEQYGGKAGLRAFLRTLLVRPGYAGLTSVGITRDADGNPKGAFQSVCSALRAAKLPVPASPGQALGTRPRIVVYILPIAQDGRMLEDVCLAAVEADPCWDCVEEYFRCLQRAGHIHSESEMPKAKVHAWLASRTPPDYRLAEAAENRLWPWDSLRRLMRSSSYFSACRLTWGARADPSGGVLSRARRGEMMARCADRYDWPVVARLRRGPPHSRSFSRRGQHRPLGPLA